jgi:hypothetical protein
MAPVMLFTITKHALQHTEVNHRIDFKRPLHWRRSRSFSIEKNLKFHPLKWLLGVPFRDLKRITLYLLPLHIKSIDHTRRVRSLQNLFPCPTSLPSSLAAQNNQGAEIAIWSFHHGVESSQIDHPSFCFTEDEMSETNFLTFLARDLVPE